MRNHALKADNFFTYNKYDKALPHYLYLVEHDTSSFDYNFKTGMCYMYLPTHKNESVNYFLRASRHFGKDTIPDLYYYLGAACQRANLFDEALNSFLRLKKLLGLNEDLLDLEKRIEACRQGIAYMAHPTNAEVTNLGPNVNSDYPDYSPVLSPDESLLIFTSKRKGTTGGRMTDDFYYYEDVYFSRRLNDDEWNTSSKIDSSFRQNALLFFLFSKAENISQINTNDHDACISMSPDGKKLFLLRGGNVYSAEYKDSKWEKPVKVSKFSDDQKDQEPSLTISADGKKSFIISDRPGGYGGKDIYVANLLPNGTWGPMENLGPVINTELDEESPFIRADTLYFSSQGHNSMGGYDVYKSVLTNGVWSEPHNLGAPINTGGDDLFLILNKKGDGAFYASEGTNSYGDLDIYSVDFGEENPMIQLKVAAFANEPLSRVPATVHITNRTQNNDSTLTSSAGNPSTFILKSGTLLNLEFSPAGYKSHLFSLQLPRVKKTSNLLVEAEIKLIRNRSGKVIGQQSTIYEIRKSLKAKFLTDSALADRRDRKAYWEKVVQSSDTNKIKIVSFTDYIDSTKAYPVDTTAIFALDTKPQTHTADKDIHTHSSDQDLHKQHPDSALTKVVHTGAPTGIAAGSGFPGTDSTSKNEFKCRPILFDFMKASIHSQDIAELKKIIAYMKQNPESRMKVEGYTDSKGSDAYNIGLSQRRAQAATGYFISQGISSKRITGIGHGKSNPAAPNEKPDGTDNPEGRKLNRRVECTIQNNK